MSGTVHRIRRRDNVNLGSAGPALWRLWSLVSAAIKEKGNINTPPELAIINKIDRVASLQSRAAHV